MSNPTFFIMSPPDERGYFKITLSMYCLQGQVNRSHLGSGPGFGYYYLDGRF
jgi:hypothetical protein